MLPLEVKACLTELLEKVYTKTQLRRLANKFGIVLEGQWKRHLSEDLLSKIPEEKEKELIQKVILEARKKTVLEDVKESLEELERFLESVMFLKVDRSGEIIPIVEPSITPDMDKEKGFLEQQMKDYGFEMASRHFRDALATYKTSYPASIAMFRNSLQALVEEIIRQKGERPLPVFTDNMQMLIN